MIWVHFWLEGNELPSSYSRGLVSTKASSGDGEIPHPWSPEENGRLGFSGRRLNDTLAVQLSRQTPRERAELSRMEQELYKTLLLKLGVQAVGPQPGLIIQWSNAMVLECIK